MPLGLTRTEARDEIMGVVAPALAGQVVLWADDDSQIAPKDSTPYMEVGVYHLSSHQVTMGTKVNGRTFRRYGYLEVLVHTPEGDGLTLADNFVTVITNALEGVTSPRGIVFRAVSGTEEGKSGIFRVTRVSADFEYDQIK